MKLFSMLLIPPPSHSLLKAFAGLPWVACCSAVILSNHRAEVCKSECSCCAHVVVEDKTALENSLYHSSVAIISAAQLIQGHTSYLSPSVATGQVSGECDYARQEVFMIMFKICFASNVYFN